MWAHNRKIRFSLWRDLNLLDLHTLETLTEWTAKAAVLVSLCGQVAHAAPVDTIIQFASTYAFLLRSADVILALSKNLSENARSMVVG
jgi:ABC-type antimicrobial peptide transport system ATPase subunit